MGRSQQNFSFSMVASFILWSPFMFKWFAVESMFARAKIATVQCNLCTGGVEFVTQKKKSYTRNVCFSFSNLENKSNFYRWCTYTLFIKSHISTVVLDTFRPFLRKFGKKYMQLLVANLFCFTFSMLWKWILDILSYDLQMSINLLIESIYFSKKNNQNIWTNVKSLWKYWWGKISTLVVE